jgi:anti-sigma regulatory factor (Ser/Thr protein kinase)
MVSPTVTAVGSPRTYRRLVAKALNRSMRTLGRRTAKACEDVPVVVWEYAAEDAALALQARPDFLDALRAASVACTETAAEIVFSELVSNVVKHAPGPIAVKFEIGTDQAFLRVYDRGPGFLLRLAVPTDLFAENGRGLFLAHEFCSELKVETSSKAGTCVSAVFAL